MSAVSASADEYPSSVLQRAEDASGAQRAPLHGSEVDPTRHRLAAGTRVGDHLVVRGVLGEGGTAVVYEALHTRLGASVALKVVDVADEYMEGARARLLREAHVCASLEDSHIPRIYDVGELPDGTPYVVMERVSGRTLENVLLQGPLPLDIAVQIAEDLLHAVEAVERAGVVHRDIKPPNIILQTSSEGTLRVRLMDFGVSKNVSSEREPSIKVNSLSNPSLTQQGAIVGTPHYMAPEQIVGPDVDTRADLYAVGVVAYEMISGRTAFEGETTGDVVAAVLHTRPLPLSRLRDVHPELEAWVERAMAPRRAERYRNAREMREALRDAWDEHLAFVAHAGQRRWAKRARWVGAVSLVALGVALPKPAGYDFSALSKLVGLGATSTETVSVQRELDPSASSTTVVPLPSNAPAAAAAQAAEPAVDLDVGNPVAPTAAPIEEAAPSAGRISDQASLAHPSARFDADAVERKRLADEADKPAALELPTAPASVVPPLGQPAGKATSLGEAAGASKKRTGLNPDAPVGPAAAHSVDRGVISPAQRGMLMGDYIQQLDKRLAPEPAAAAPGAPAADRLPDNPYGE